MVDWKTFVGGKIYPSGMKVMDDYFAWKGIKNPTLDDIRNLTEDEIMSLTVSVPTLKQIMLLQQQIG